MKLTQEIDGFEFIKCQVENIMASYKYCYPNNLLQESKCHGGLMAIKSSADALLDFLKNIKIKEVE